MHVRVFEEEKHAVGAGRSTESVQLFKQMVQQSDKNPKASTGGWLTEGRLVPIHQQPANIKTGLGCRELLANTWYAGIREKNIHLTLDRTNN